MSYPKVKAMVEAGGNPYFHLVGVSQIFNLLSSRRHVTVSRIVASADRRHTNGQHVSFRGLLRRTKTTEAEALEALRHIEIGDVGVIVVKDTARQGAVMDVETVISNGRIER